MMPTDMIRALENDPLSVEFEDVIAIIDAHYQYVPTRFTNGLQTDDLQDKPLVNAAGENEGACKILAFARIWGLTEAQTLACFGRYYREDVLPHPAGTDHQNIRRFISDGWEGVRFEGEALTPL